MNNCLKIYFLQVRILDDESAKSQFENLYSQFLNNFACTYFSKFQTQINKKFSTYLPSVWSKIQNSELVKQCHEQLTNALSFYKSRNVLRRSNFFESAQKFDCIQCIFKKFCAGTKNKFTECKSSFCLTQNVCDGHNTKKNVWSDTKNLDWHKTFCNLYLKGQGIKIYFLQVRIPDDESAKSQFGIIDDELEEQLRDILEANETKHGDIYVPKS